MADDIQVKDAAGVTRVLRATDPGSGSLVPHHITDALARSVTDASGVTGSASAMLTAASATRQGWLVQNQHATDKIYVNALGAAAVVGQPSLTIAPLAMLASPKDVPLTTAQINVLGTNPADPFTAWVW